MQFEVLGLVAFKNNSRDEDWEYRWLAKVKRGDVVGLVSMLHAGYKRSVDEEQWTTDTPELFSETKVDSHPDQLESKFWEKQKDHTKSFGEWTELDHRVDYVEIGDVWTMICKQTQS